MSRSKAVFWAVLYSESTAKQNANSSAKTVLKEIKSHLCMTSGLTDHDLATSHAFQVMIEESLKAFYFFNN